MIDFYRHYTQSCNAERHFTVLFHAIVQLLLVRCSHVAIPVYGYGSTRASGYGTSGTTRGRGIVGVQPKNPSAGWVIHYRITTLCIVTT